MRRGSDAPSEASAARTRGASGPRFETPKRSRGSVYERGSPGSRAATRRRAAASKPLTQERPSTP
jgi:hypothetical protein